MQHTSNEFYKNKTIKVQNYNGVTKSSRKIHISNQTQLESAPLIVAVFTYFNFAVLTIFGIFYELLKILWTSKSVTDELYEEEGFVNLYRGCESFFVKHIYNRARHIFERPVLSNPGIIFDVAPNKRYSENPKTISTNISKTCINLASYDYLGFADKNDYCRYNVENTIRKNGISACIPYFELGQCAEQAKLERSVSEFLGTEDCITFGMGFATNSCNIQCLVDKNCLVLSDELNHSSIVIGIRMSGARVVIFPHNDVNALEDIIRTEIINGHPKSHRPWKKILIVVEGVYSMEGTMCNLPELIRIKKKYRCYIYLDEAHSIGAIGQNGKGIVDYYKCNVRDVDVMMGTFTKSFSSSGGYIAGTKKLVNHIRRRSHANLYASSMSPAVCQQIISTLSIICGKSCDNDGQRRIKALAFNTKYIYSRLQEAGFILYSNGDSPIIPILVYLPAKLAYFSEELLRNGVAVVGVGFPATSLLECRIRLCLSANLTIEMMDRVISILIDVGRQCGVLYRKK